MKLEIISESEFNQIDGLRKIIINEHSHQFARLDLGKPDRQYGLSWGSSTIQPAIETSTDARTIWVGVDGHRSLFNSQVR